MVNSMQNLKYITFVPFANFNLWDVNRYKINSDFKSIHKTIKLSEILFQVDNSETLIADKDYKLCGISSYGLGMFHREIKKGREIQAKRLNKIKKNQFIYSRLGANNGSFAMVTDNFNNYFVSNEFPTFEIKNNLVKIEYLEIVFKLPFYWKTISKQLQGAAHKRFKENLFLNLEIPLPTIEEQNRIVARYNAKIQLAQQQEEKAKTLETEIERYLFDELGIEINVNKGIKKGLNMINFSDINEWGADRALRGNNDILFSKKYPSKKLSIVAMVNPRTQISNLKDNDEMSFVPMECVSDDYGEIKELRNGIKKTSSGYTKFQENDLIWARITPCMQNGKSALVNGLSNNLGYGSTEFHIVRKLNENFNIEFAYHLLRSKTVRKDATNYFTGSAGQQRVPKSYLENLLVPIPPVEIQIQISNHINAIKEQIKELNTLSAKNKEEAIIEFEKEIFN